MLNNRIRQDAVYRKSALNTASISGLTNEGSEKVLSEKSYDSESDIDLDVFEDEEKEQEELRLLAEK